MKQNHPTNTRTHPNSSSSNNHNKNNKNNNNPPSSPNRRREQQREQALASFRNDRIKKAYGAPCPYKQSPDITEYTRPTPLHHTSGDHEPYHQVREYYAPISHRHPQQQQHYSSYEDIILGDVRPVSASRLQFNNSEFLGISSNSSNHNNNNQNNDTDDHPDYDHTGGGCSRQPRPATSGAYSSPKRHPSSPPRKQQQQQHSPRRLILTDLREDGDGRGDSSSCYYRLDPGAGGGGGGVHGLGGGGGLEEDSDTAAKEQRAVLAISAAIIDPRGKPGHHPGKAKEQGKEVMPPATAHAGDKDDSSSNYYEEIEEDKTEIHEDCEGGRNENSNSNSNHDDLYNSSSIDSDVEEARHKSLSRHRGGRGLLHGDTGTAQQQQQQHHKQQQHQQHFRHYPSSRQQDRMAAMPPLELRRIVPSFDKNYLRARPLPVKSQGQGQRPGHAKSREGAAARLRPPLPSASTTSSGRVREQLCHLGLFTHPQSAGGQESSEDHRRGGDRPHSHQNQNNSMEVEISRYQQTQQRAAMMRRKAAAGNNQERERDHSRASSATRPSTAGAPSSRGGGGGGGRTNASSSAGYARRVTSAVSESKHKYQQQQQSNKNSQSARAGATVRAKSASAASRRGGDSGAQQQQAGGGGGDGGGSRARAPSGDSKTSAGTGIGTSQKSLGEAGGGEEEEVFEVGMMIQARYKDREQWWQGKIVGRSRAGDDDAAPRKNSLRRSSRSAQQLSQQQEGAGGAGGFRYSIRYGEILEKQVPPQRMRKRGSAKAKLKTFIAKDVMADRLLHSEGFPEYTEGQGEGQGQGESSGSGGSPGVAQQQGSQASPPPLLGSQKLAPEKKYNRSSSGEVMSKVVVVASVNEGLDMPQQQQQQQRKPNNLFLSGLTLNPGGADGGISFKSPGLRKTVTNEKSAETLTREEKEKEEKREKERKEQERLHKELTTVVTEKKNNIVFSDLTFEHTIGRGKFASVHRVMYRCRVHCEQSRTDRRDNLADSLHILEGNSSSAGSGGKSSNDLAMQLAVKTPEYRHAQPLYPPARDSCEDHTATALPPSVQLLETIREVKALQALNHPNIINFYGVCLAPRLCVALELLDHNLAELLGGKAAAGGGTGEGEGGSRRAPLTPPQRVQVLQDVCRGLQFMHSQRFAHLDIKPHNILLRAATGGYAAKLADFGTAVQLAEGEVLTTPVGTSGYTAPEISLPGRYDERADVFSLAIVMWEVLVSAVEHTGTSTDTDSVPPPPVVNPFAGKDLDEAACDAHGGVRPCLRASCVPGLSEVVARAWATAPGDRAPLSAILQALDDAALCPPS